MGKQILIYEVAVQEIINLIRTRNLKKGDKLPPERELVKQLQISRACIREALQVLSSNYIVQIKPGSGIYVNVLDKQELSRFSGGKSSKEEVLEAVRNIIEMRRLIETYGFQQAAKTITSEQLHRMYSHEASEFSTYLSDTKGATGASMNLEQMILACQSNTILTGIHGRLNETWKTYMSKLDAVALPPDIRHRDHLDIIMAVENNQPKQIAKAVAKHLDGTYRAVERLLGKG